MRETVFKGAIFDMDGLLVDSEPFWMEAAKEVLAEAGLELSSQMCLQTQGLRIKEIVEYWNNRFPLSVDIGEITNQLESNVTERITQGGQALPGVQHVLEQLHQAGFSIGLASSSPLPIIQSVIQKLEIADYFQITLSANDLIYGKPHPLVYLECARLLELPPSDCIAFEDSITGLIAAKAANIFSLAVPEPANFNNPRFQIADRVLTSLEAFRLELLNG